MGASVLKVRWMIRGDLAAVCSIDADSYSPPMFSTDFVQMLKEKTNTGMVVEANGVVVAFTFYRLNPKEVKVLRFAVDPWYRREGVGTLLMHKLEEKLNEKRSILTCQVVETNLDGCLFLKDRGWTATTIDRGAGPGGRDVFNFQYPFQYAY